MARGHSTDCHTYQRTACEFRLAEGPILNAACKEDPGGLSRYGVTNFDICLVDEQTGRDLTKLPNFVHGSVLEASKHFAKHQFATIVLGEYIEHCVPNAVEATLLELRAILKDDGYLVITFPLDNRPAESQHAKHLLKVWWPGETGHDITVWHQTWWTDEMLVDLFAKTGFVEESRQVLGYGFVNHPAPEGWGIMLRKVSLPA